jgi:hypothetical protein
MAISQRLQFDVCIVCALPEEAKAAISIIEKEYGVKFQRAETKRKQEYRFAQIQKGRNKINIHISWAADKGPVEMVLHLFPTLTEFKPRWVFMTGICAGDRRAVQLGDLIVAKRTYFYDNGKVEMDVDRKTEVYLPDTDTRRGDPCIVHDLAMFDGWKKYVKKLDRPISKHQQRDWILSRLLEGIGCVADIPKPELKKMRPRGGT